MKAVFNVGAGGVLLIPVFNDLGLVVFVSAHQSSPVDFPLRPIARRSGEIQGEKKARQRAF